MNICFYDNVTNIRYTLYEKIHINDNFFFLYLTELMLETNGKIG